MKNREKFSWLIALTLLVMGLGSWGCTYDTCETDEDCNQAEGEICLPAKSCGKAGDSCTHGEFRDCTIGQHSRGTTRGNFGECNKTASKNKKGRTEICIGGAWIASTAAFDQVRQAYEQINFAGAPLLSGFDLSKQSTIFGILTPDDLAKVALDLDRKVYVLCGDGSENKDPYGQDINEQTGQPIDPDFISQEICNGLNDDCDANPKITDPTDALYAFGSIDEDFIGEQVIVQNLSGNDLNENLKECLSGAADADGFCLCAEEGAKGACVRRGVQTCEAVAGGGAKLACSGVEVAPVPSRFACNGVDDNCNGVVDEFLVLEPTDIQHSFNKLDGFDPRVDVMSATSIEIKNRVSYLFATEVAAEDAGELPEIDLNVLYAGTNQLEELLLSEDAGVVGTKQIYGLNPHLESTKLEGDTQADEYGVLFYLGQIEYNCTNGLDDDGDGLIDCEDGVECDAECNESGKCFNLQDDDSDGFTDCEDSECFADCAGSATAEDCTLAGDEDGNGLHDCADPVCCGDTRCEDTHFCKLELCGNGVDDDGDGAKDCDDTECCDMPACEYAVACRVETDCFGDTDTVDGDGDGLAGCYDPDCCLRNTRCTTGSINPPRGPVLVCVVEDCATLNADLNSNGLSGCDDPACQGNLACIGDSQENREEECRTIRCGTTPAERAKCSNFNFCHEDCLDNIDNNGDGDTDCDDVRCAQTPACDATPSVPNCALALFEDKYHPDCMPCEYGGSACKKETCVDQATDVDPTVPEHSMCADANDDTIPDATAAGCNIGFVDDVTCARPECADSVFCEDRRELCHNFVDDDGDGLVDCEDIGACGYSAFCSQELWVQIRSFKENSIDNSVDSIQKIICLTCDDEAAVSGGRDVPNELGVRKFLYKNRPNFFEVVPRSNGEFFVVYSRVRRSGNGVSSSLFSTSVKVTDVAPKATQDVRFVGADLSPDERPIRAAQIRGKAASSEVQMILLEEITGEIDGGVGAERVGKLRLFKGAISSSSSAFDVYASRVEGAGATPSLTDEIPIQKFPRLNQYPFDIVTGDDRVWIAYVASDASQGETLKVQAYNTSTGGATDIFQEVVEGEAPNDRAVNYPLKKVQEGWVINTSPVPGDDKDSTDASTQAVYQFSNVQLTPICQEVVGSTECNQMLLSFYESGSTLAAPHFVSVNTVSRDNSRIGDEADPGAIPLGAVINESKTEPRTYATLQNGQAAHVFVETRIADGYRIQTGGFLTSQEPQLDFIYSLDEIPTHIRFAEILDAAGDAKEPRLFIVRRHPGNEIDQANGTPEFDALVAQLPEELRIDASRVDIKIREFSRDEYHIHWSTLVGTTNLVPYADELSCDDPSDSFSGYGLADSVPVAAPETPPGN